MSNAIEADLLIVETEFLETTMKHFPTNNNMKHDIIKQRLIKQDYDLHRSVLVNANDMNTSISMHEQWCDHESHLKLSDQ